VQTGSGVMGVRRNTEWQGEGARRIIRDWDDPQVSRTIWNAVRVRSTRREKYDETRRQSSQDVDLEVR
jgi:hypothetical protein